MDFLPLLLAKACAVKAIWAAADVRFGSKADIAASPTDVRFSAKSGHWNSAAKCPLCAACSTGRRNTF